MEITGSLVEGQSLSYEIEARLLKAFLMTEEDVEQHASPSFRREYNAFYVVSLVDELEISITFPETFQANFYCGVAMGDVVTQAAMNSEELNRIEKNQWFKKDQKWARLKVQGPLIGFSYLIYWTPPPKNVIDALKNA